MVRVCGWRVLVRVASAVIGGQWMRAWQRRLPTCACCAALGCAQAYDVTVNGSYAYVVGTRSDSLAIVDVSNKAAPALAGSLVDSTVMDYVRRFALTRASGCRCLAPCTLHTALR